MHLPIRVQHTNTHTLDSRTVLGISAARPLSTYLSHVLPADGALVPGTQNPHPGGALVANRMVTLPDAVYLHGPEAHHTHLVLLTTARAAHHRPGTRGHIP